MLTWQGEGSSNTLERVFEEENYKASSRDKCGQRMSMSGG